MLDRIIRHITLLVGIAVAGTIVGIGVAATSEPTTADAFVAARQVYGLTALGFLLGACLIGPITGVFPRLPFKRILLAARRAVGVSAFVIAIPHVACYLWPVLLRNWRELYQPGPLWVVGLLLGLFTLLDLTVLAWTSRDAAVKALGGKRWKWLHRTVYIAVPVVFLHALFVGADFGLVTPPTGEADLGSLIAFSLLAAVWLFLAWLRSRGFFWPVRPVIADDRITHLNHENTVNTAQLQAEAPAATKSFPAASPSGPVSTNWNGILRVNRIFDETPGVKTFRFTAMDGGPIPFTYVPGQYLSVLPMIDGIRTSRSYTIASSPTQRHYCELTIKREEDGQGVSKYFHDGLQEGALIEVRGPTGKFTFTGKEAKNVVLIGGGIGITPLMSYARYLTDSGWPGNIYFLYTCRRVSDFIFRAELERLCARHPKLHLVVTISRPNEERWDGLTGRLTKEVITQSVPDIATRLVYVCGPDKMMKAVQGALLELDVPTAHVKTEAFSAPQNASAEGEIMPDAPAQKPVDADAKRTTEAPVETSGEAKETKPDFPIRPSSAEDSSTGTTPTAVAHQVPPVTTEGPAAATAMVTFKKSNKTAPLTPDMCILEAAEAVGVNIDFKCRVGTCGTCKVTLLSGAVTMEIEDALSAEEKSKGRILACQAKSTGNCAVDA